MITRNWYNAFKAYRKQSIIEKGLVTHNGGSVNAGWYNNTGILPLFGLYLTSVTYKANGTGIMLGSGTTPATLDDYKLESQITSGLSCSVAVSADDDNDAVFKVTITNISSEDITIGEIGMQNTYYSMANSNTAQYCLSERTVLDNPITIPAGGIGLIDYAIKLTIPQE